MSWMDKGDWKPSTTGPNPCDEIQLGPAESCRLESKKELNSPLDRLSVVISIGGRMLLVAQVDDDSIYPVGWTNDLGEANRAVEFLGPSYEIFKIPEIKGNFIMIRGIHEKKYPINVFSVTYSEVKSVTGEEVQDDSRTHNVVVAHSKGRVDELLSEMSRVSTHECR